MKKSQSIQKDCGDYKFLVVLSLLKKCSMICFATTLFSSILHKYNFPFKPIPSNMYLHQLSVSDVHSF